MKVAWIIAAIFFVLLLPSCIINPEVFDEGKWRKKAESRQVEKLYAPYYKDEKFFNPWMPMEPKNFLRVLKWRFSKKRYFTPEEENFKPNIISNLKERIKAIPRKDFIAWIGHSTFFMRFQGEYWLTDPMFSERALLPKRATPPGISADGIKELTKSVNVIISHNHYDHLDAASIRSLPEKTRFFVPLGLKKLIESYHKGIVTELDWWKSIDLKGGAKLVCLPAQHWSRRINQPANSTLWASYMLITSETSIYYGGDSGYFMGYREIGKRFPGIRYALLPVTAYHPRWFMHYNHMNAQEALRAFKDLDAKYFIPTQWGTFRLGDNPPGTPALDLGNAMQQMNMDPSRIIIMDIGQIKTTR